MSPISKTTLADWQNQQANDPEFVAAEREMEAGYQITRLRILRGLTQSQLAERVGTHQPSIARLESGQSSPSLSFLKRIVEALDGNLEIHIAPNGTK